MKPFLCGVQIVTNRNEVLTCNKKKLVQIKTNKFLVKEPDDNVN